jgi:RNA polymerase sigma-70 factor (ECF subfamily)
MTDQEIVQRVRSGETALFEVLMRRHNQRVYRVARAVLKDETEAEDAMQQAYINAYLHLTQFEDRAQFSTWLTRIVVREALARRRRSRPEETVETFDRTRTEQPDPEHQAYAGELGRLIEGAIDVLPEAYRVVFMLREVEGLSTSETADTLELGEEAVKTRLHRARAMIRRVIRERLGGATPAVFQFAAPRCDRVVAGVLARLQTISPDTQKITAPAAPTTSK